MSRRLTITAAEWASREGDTLWLVRESDVWDEDGLLYQPDEFVEACAPCETCHEGRLWVQTAPDDMQDCGPCPDCRIELWAPCPDCDDDDGHTAVVGHAYPVGQPERQADGRWAIELAVGS